MVRKDFYLRLLAQVYVLRLMCEFIAPKIIKEG